MRRSPIAGVSWLQLVAGALAAMTSAWVASYLGVAGTIIGAAVGSLVASIASALYVNGLDRGTTFISESGSVVSRAPATGTDDEAEVLVAQDDTMVTVDAAERGFSWRRVMIWAGIPLVAALVIIGGYELATGTSFGNSDNPTITRPWGESGAGGDETEDGPARPGDGTDPTEAPQDERTTAPPTPAPTETPAPEPTPEPTAEPPVEPPADPEPEAPAPPG